MCLEWIFFFDHASRMDLMLLQNYRAELYHICSSFLLRRFAVTKMLQNQDTVDFAINLLDTQLSWTTKSRRNISPLSISLFHYSLSISLSLSWDSKVFNGFYWAMNVRMNSCLIGIGILDLVVICRIPVFN